MGVRYFFCFCAAVAIAVFSLLARPVAADVVSFEPARDATLYESDDGSIGNGAGIGLFAGKTSQTTGSLRRALVFFDISQQIPRGSTINSVTLDLNLSLTGDLEDRSVALHRALEDWGEGPSDPPGSEGGGAPALPGDTTWLHQFEDGLTWSVPGGAFEPTASASIPVGDLGRYSWGPTAGMVADVQHWLDTPLENFGWILLSEETVGGTTRRFDSRSVADVALRPKLTVDFTPPTLAPSLAAAVLPSSRSIGMSDTATAFASIVNVSGASLQGCRPQLAVPAPVSFGYQTTDPLTNSLTGSPDLPVNLDHGATQSFVLRFTPQAAFSPRVLGFDFTCDSGVPARRWSGLNDLLLSANTEPTPDVIALAATEVPGILVLGGSQRSGAFAVAVTNVGASGTLTLSVEASQSNLELAITFCEIALGTSDCIAPPSQSLSRSLGSNEIASFAFFVSSPVEIPFDPATTRLFVRFLDEAGTSRGATSVALRSES